MNDFSDVTVVILAGGRGTRLQGLFPDTPKPMIPVAGKPFLHWLTLWIARHGPRHFVYSTGHLSTQIEAWIADDSLPSLYRAHRREESALGTGGGLLNCLDLCSEWILVANGDGLVMKGISELLGLREQPGVDGGLIGVEVEDTARYGSLAVDPYGWLTGFREKIPGKGLINGGVYLFRTSLLLALERQGPCSIEYDLFPELIKKGAKLGVIPLAQVPFIDIGTPETIREATHFISEHFPRDDHTNP